MINIGKELLSNNLVSFMGLKDIKLTPEINWLENPYNNRTWMWHLHQMSFIKFLILYDKEKSSLSGSNYAIDLIKSWVNQFQRNLTNVFAWHDHASAIRAQNLLKLIDFTKDKISKDDYYFLIECLVLHAKQLELDSFYSKATNHGLD